MSDSIHSDDPYASPRKPERNLIMALVARFIMRLVGWKIKGQFPNLPKFVIVAGPHTSNTDGLLLLAVIWALRIRLDWLAKIELIRIPVIGWISRKLGAIPIDRSASFNAVEQAIQQINQREKMILVVAPEGTRRKTEYWKTGFYWIAHGADIPILTVVVNYRDKCVDLNGPLIKPSGDIEADMQIIWDFFQTGVGRHPERTGEMRLRPSSLRPPGSNTDTSVDNRVAGGAAEIE